MHNLLKEIEKWSEHYDFSFQFWGKGQNNVYIERDGVELQSFGGEETIEDILKIALDWIKKVNKQTNK